VTAPDLPPLLAAALAAATAMSAAALALSFLRLIRGPSLADRVIAVDLITTILVILLTLAGLALDDGAYLDAAVALALVAFLATVAFARYIDRRDGGRPRR
jgi:multicomponent Na+:H+ antiporter subunit F